MPLHLAQVRRERIEALDRGGFTRLARLPVGEGARPVVHHLGVGLAVGGRFVPALALGRPVLGLAGLALLRLLRRLLRLRAGRPLLALGLFGAGFSLRSILRLGRSRQGAPEGSQRANA